MKRVDKLLSQMVTPQKLKTRQFTIKDIAAAIIFHPDISDGEIIRNAIMSLQDAQNPSDIQSLKRKMVDVAEVKIKEKNVLIDILSGDSVIVIDGVEGYIVVGTKKWDKRAVMEPPTETVQWGPREGFVEDIKTNLSLLERRLTTPAFAVEKIKIGRVTQTDVALCYISTIASPKLIKLIREKLAAIDVDGIIDSHYLQPLIEPHPNSIFHQTGMTEKPDIVASKLLEGRVAVVCGGSPLVLTAPFLFVEDFQSAEDYYERSTFSTFLRSLRFVAVFLAVFLPGLYVAMQVFHYNIVPIKLLITLMNAVKGIPMTPMSEILFVLLLFEIIREASVRMPRAVGMAMSIVGGLVLGETAVKSGMISSPAVMIVALSSIALYTVPNEVGVISLMRVAFTFLGGLGGLYGLILGILFFITVLVNFDSFGTPYLAPFAPLIFPDLKDSFYLANTRYHKRRPYSIPNINRRRQD